MGLGGFDLFYVRDKRGKTEVDFLVSKDGDAGRVQERRREGADPCALRVPLVFRTGFWQNAVTKADGMKKAGKGKTAAAPPRDGRGGGNAAARILVGLWLDGVSGQETMDGIHAELSSRALDWNVRFSDSPAAFETNALWMLGTGRLDGVVTRYHVSEAMDRIRAAGIPAVLLFPDSRPDGGARRPPRTAFVEMDVEAVAREAVAHFSARAASRRRSVCSRRRESRSTTSPPPAVSAAARTASGACSAPRRA